MAATKSPQPNSFSRHSRPSTDSADPLDVGRPRRGSLKGDGSVGGPRRGGDDEEERAKIQTGANVQVFITAPVVMVVVFGLALSPAESQTPVTRKMPDPGRWDENGLRNVVKQDPGWARPPARTV